MTNLRIYAGPEHPHAAQNPEKLDVACHELQKCSEGALMPETSAKTFSGLDKGAAAPAAEDRSRPVHVQKLDAHGRAYATGKRKNAVARVWVKPGAGQDHRER